MKVIGMKRNQLKTYGVLKDFYSPVRIPTSYNGAKVDAEFSKWHDDKYAECKVLHITDFRTLLQAVDKARYLLSKNGRQAKLFLRGQTQFSIRNMRVSLYRNLKKNEGMAETDQRQDQKLNKFLKSTGETLKTCGKDVLEGVFQQYGLLSRWLDAVDNVWIALWFACHQYWPEHINRQCGTYVKRTPFGESFDRRFCYILLLGRTVENEVEISPGHWKMRGMELMDLRYALPSQYLRPHMQHGVLLRALNKQGEPQREFASILQGVIRIDLQNALEWIGDGKSFQLSNIFPGPMFDSGYRELLEDFSKAGISCPMVTP